MNREKGRKIRYICFAAFSICFVIGWIVVAWLAGESAGWIVAGIVFLIILLYLIIGIWKISIKKQEELKMRFIVRGVLIIAAGSILMFILIPMD